MEQLHNNISTNAKNRLLFLRSNIENKVAEALTKLPTEKAMLFSMYFLHGYTMTAIGKFCGEEQTTISRRLKRIVRELNGKIVNKSKWRNKPGSTNTLRRIG